MDNNNRPPSRLDNGKSNPDYWRWYRARKSELDEEHRVLPELLDAIACHLDRLATASQRIESHLAAVCKHLQTDPELCTSADANKPQTFEPESANIAQTLENLKGGVCANICKHGDQSALEPDQPASLPPSPPLNSPPSPNTPNPPYNPPHNPLPSQIENSERTENLSQQGGEKSLIISTNCAEPEKSAGTSIAKTASKLEPTSLDDQTEYVVDSGTVTAYVKPLRGVHLAYDLLPPSWRTEEMRQMLGEYDAHRRALGKPPWTDAEVKRKIAQWTTRTPSEVISAAYRSIATDLVVESAEAAEMPEPEPQQQDLLEEFDPYAE